MTDLAEQRRLAEETVLYGGMVLKYCLTDEGTEMQNRFRVSVESGTEFAQTDLGNDICAATDCYRAVRDGSVTPCVLEEVVRDFLKCRQTFEKPLYK